MRHKLLLIFTLWLACISLAHTAPTPSYCLLIVGDERNPTMMSLENQLVDKVRGYLAEQGIPQKKVPILVYHFNKPAEKAYCEKKLGLTKSDLPFLGYAQMSGLVVTKVLLRYSQIENASSALAMLAADLNPQKSTPPPPPPPPPPPSPIIDRVPYSPPAAEVRLFDVQTCRGVIKGKPLATTVVFAPNETFYLYMRADNVQVGTVFQVVWNHGGYVVRQDNGQPGTFKYVVRTAEEGFYLYFYIRPPARGWPPGEYRANILVDGKELTTAQFTVR